MNILYAILGKPHPVKITPNEKVELGSRREKIFGWVDAWAIGASLVFAICFFAILDSYGVKISLPKVQVVEVASTQAMPMGIERGFTLLKEPTPINPVNIEDFSGLIKEYPQKLTCKGDVYISVDRPGSIYLVNLSEKNVKVFTPETFPGGVKLKCRGESTILIAFRTQVLNQNYVRLGD